TMKLSKIFFFILLLAMELTFVGAQAAELDGIKLPDDLMAGDKKLGVHCLGMRKVTKFGLPFKVYIGALYLEKKNSDSDDILKNDEAKVMIMHFVRSVDRDKLVDAFQEGLENGCYVDCDK